MKKSPNTIIPTLPTTITTKIPKTTISTTLIKSSIIKNLELEPCINERCLECDKGSNSLKLCLSCDETLYDVVNYTREFSKYIDCFKKSNLLTKFYYENITKQYKPCYKLCKRCLGPGNATDQNCLECEANYMLRPGNNPNNNCVVFSEFYYLSPYDEYRPMLNPQCPQVAKYRVNGKYCIYDCKADKYYKYLYNGNCVENCSLIEGTENINFICKETDNNKIYINENQIYLDTNDSIGIIQTLAITYAKEFNYTNKHISLYKNEQITVVLYKDVNINETQLKTPDIDFGNCYDKVINYYNLTGKKLIKGIIDKNEKNIPSTFYLFFHPETGLKLEVGEICINDTIEIKQNLLSFLDEKNNNYELQISLTKQGINIFDKKDPFYKDICYDFDNPKNKDIALKDRIKETFVDAILCDDRCINTGMDITNNIAICNCKFNDVTNNDLIHENAALEYFVGDLFDFINSSNIFVLKCYKYIFKYFSRSIGGIIILVLFILDIIFVFVFFFYELTKIKRYIFVLTEDFTLFLSNYPDLANFFPPKKHHLNNTKDKLLNFGFQKDKDKKINKYYKKMSSKSMKTINNNSNKIINSKELMVYNKKNSIKKLTQKYDKSNENKINSSDKGNKMQKYFKKYLSTLPDDMEFDDAIHLDKRKICQYFCDLLGEKQSFAYTFCASDKIKTRMIKYILFVLNINLYLVVNGLFFSESYISELYHINDENENFLSFIPRNIDKIIYTSIVGVVINYIADFFFLSENKIKGIFKREKNNKVILKGSIFLLIKEIQKRYISFIILNIILFLFSLYYVLCFNYVYPNTQIEWIKSSIFIIILMQVLSIFKCLIETLLRFLSFKCESEKLYKVSKFL